jgi:molecular chaperone GrpE (heat shock protein)
MEAKEPQTPEEWRRWIVEQAARDFRAIAREMQAAKEQIRATANPKLRHDLERALANLERTQRKLKRDITKWLGHVPGSEEVSGG